MIKELSNEKNKKQSLFLKWLITSVLFYGVITSLLLYFFYWRATKTSLHANLLEQAEMLIQSYSPRISSARDKKDDISMMDHLSSIAKNPSVSHIKVVSEDGIILYHNNVHLWGKPDDSVGIKNILSSTITLIQEIPEGYEYSKPLMATVGEKIGHIILRVRTEGIDNELESKKRQMMYVILALLLVYILFNFFMYKTFVRTPLRSITNMLNAFLLGKLEDRIKPDKINDYTETALLVNKILDKIKSSQKESRQSIVPQASAGVIVKIVSSIATSGAIVLNNEDNVVFINEEARKILKTSYTHLSRKKHILDVTTNETIINTFKDAVKNLGIVLTANIEGLNLKTTVVAIDDENKNHIATVILLAAGE